MPAIIINNSPNIASLDEKIVADLCGGIFYVDITPSVWIGTGYNNVMGASVQIINPYNVAIKNYPTSGYDIYSPMTDVIEVDVPTQAGNYQYGQYAISVQLTDANGTIYTISKQVNICAPNPLNKTVKYGSLSALLNGSCKNGAFYIITDTVPAYGGVISNSQVNAFTLEYPTSSGKSVLSTTIGSFSDVLFEGVYKWKGTICANYNIGDNVSVKVNYQVYKEKNIKCVLDETCLAAAFSNLNSQINSDCTDAEKEQTQATLVQAMALIKNIELLVDSGLDASDYIDQLEDVLGCVCTCNCAVGTPIINNSPNKDFNITGCGFTKTTVGLTDTYTFDPSNLYIVAVNPNGGVLTVTAPVLSDCTQTQTFSFNIAAAYTQIKALINNSTEYNYWASIINKSWDSLDVSCLGYNSGTWATLTYSQRSQIIFNKLCAGGGCSAIISTNSTNSSASNVVASWTNVSGVYEVLAYLDGEFYGSVLAPISTFTFLGAADGASHTYELVAKCTNGAVGYTLTGNFTYYGCPTIAYPTVTSNNVTSSSCPYDLTALVNTLPMGITAEWHNLNNTNNLSLVSDPSSAIGGIYYVFAKNSDGCYSTGTQVILTCTGGSGCSAPQTLIVEDITSGYRVRFQSAAFPPPLNSYTVKRRLASAPDISGSYTTIGTPTWNASVNRWEILDNTGTDNTLYVYRAISNCTSSAPYADYTFANITCPAVTLTPAETELGYSFTNSGGEIDKYEVKLYDTTGTTLIHTDTWTPSFANPITGTFLYLTSGVAYKVRLRVYIGTYYLDCAFYSTATTGAFTFDIPTNNSSDISLTSLLVNGSSITLLGQSGGLPVGTGATRYSTDDLGATPASVYIAWTAANPTQHISLLDTNGSLVHCIDVSADGNYTFLNVDLTGTSPVTLQIEDGGC